MKIITRSETAALAVCEHVEKYSKSAIAGSAVIIDAELSEEKLNPVSDLIIGCDHMTDWDWSFLDDCK